MPFIEEFLYRGRADGTSDTHVVLGAMVDDGFGAQKLQLKGPMTPTDAAAAGFDVATVVAGINTVTMTSLQEAQAQVAAITQQMADAATKAASDLAAAETKAASDLAAAAADKAQAVSALQGQVTSLEQQVAALTPTVPDGKVLVRKSTVIQRLADAGKLDAALAALQSDALSYALWQAPDWPNVYADDPRVLAMLQAIGADPAVILAPDPTAVPG